MMDFMEDNEPQFTSITMTEDSGLVSDPYTSTHYPASHFQGQQDPLAFTSIKNAFISLGSS